MPENKIPEEFWVKETDLTNLDMRRLLCAEINRLEEENAELKIALQEVKVQRDTYQQQAIQHERSNAILVKQGGRK